MPNPSVKRDCQKRAAFFANKTSREAIDKIISQLLDEN